MRLEYYPRHALVKSSRQQSRQSQPRRDVTSRHLGSAVRPAFDRRARLCEGIIEAAWLAAVLVVPVLVNPHSELGFHPNKMVFFQGLALLVCAAWLTKSIGSPHGWSERWRGMSRTVRGAPLLLPLAVLSLTYLVSSCFSINPVPSLWGAYEPMEGLFSFGCGLVLLVAILTHLRRREQLDRVLTAIIVPGLPIALYGLLQRAGYAPSPMGARVTSLMGNPIFLGAYLLLTLPVLIWRIGGLISDLRRGVKSWRLVGVGVYGLVLFSEGLVFLFTESRGPLLGLVAGAFFFLVSLGILRRSRAIILGGAGAVIAGLTLLVLLNLPNGPLQRWTSLPVLERISQIFSREEAIKSIRAGYWGAAIRIMRSERPLAFPTDGHDSYHALRPVIGYGPETVLSVLPREYTHPGTDPPLTNRLHNLALDTWLSLGAVGLASLAVLLVLTFFQVYRHVGWLPSRASAGLFFGLAAGGAGTGVLLALWQAAALAGLGLQFGLATGLVAYPLCLPWLSRSKPYPSDFRFGTGSLLLALLSALLAHLVETAFSFETPATSSLVWVYLGIILALCRVRGSEPTDAAAIAPPGGPARPKNGAQEAPELCFQQVATASEAEGPCGPPSKPSKHAELLPAGLTALLLVSLLFGLIRVHTATPLSTLEVVVQSMTHPEEGKGSHPLLIALILATWGFSAFVFTLDHLRLFPHESKGRVLGLALTVSGAIAVSFLFLDGWQLARIGPIPQVPLAVETVLKQCSGYLDLCLWFGATLLALLLFVAWACRTEVACIELKRVGGPIFALLCIPAAAGVLWFTGIRFLRADVSCRWAEDLNSAGNATMAAAVYRHTLSIDPKPIVYRFFAARVSTDLAQKAVDRQEYEYRMAEAESALLAWSCKGQDRAAFYLGQHYLRWALHEPDPTRRLALAQKATAALDTALVFEPKYELAWRESAHVDLLLRGRPAAAQAKLRRATELVVDQNENGAGPGKMAFAIYYTERSRGEADPALKRQYATYAREYYDEALQDATAAGSSRFAMLFSKAGLLWDLGQLQQAVVLFSEAADFGDEPQAWMAERALAEVYTTLKDQAAAKQHLRRALHKAPADEKLPLLDWWHRIR